MEAMRELEAQVLARRAPAPAREDERAAEAAAPAMRRKFRGVRCEKSGNYGASITYPGEKKATWLGTYTDAAVAACVYDLAARFLQGPKAKTNFDYPPPLDLIAAARTAPGRRGPLYPVVSTPAPAPAAAPPAAPAPVPIEYAHDFSFKAPPREPAACPVCPFLTDTRPARARLGLAPEPEAKITLLRSIPPKAFNFQAAAAASQLVSNPVDLLCPQIHIVMPASSTETCFSSTSTCKTDPQLRASASSSRRMPSNGRHLMLKTPKIFLVPKTVRTPSTSDEGFTGDNFTGVNVLTDFTLPPSAPMPFDVSEP